MARQINGVLLEGVDYAGKTTIARLLQDACAREGVAARYAKEFATADPQVTALAARANALPLGYEQDRLLAEAAVADIDAYQDGDAFVVQDRHWLSMAAQLGFLYPDRDVSLCDRLVREHVPFACQVYLTSTLEAKRARIAACPPRSTLDAWLAADPIRHQRYDEHMRALIPPAEDWLILDTSELTIEDAATAIMTRVRPWLVSPQASRCAIARG